MDLSTLEFELDEATKLATVTLNRPTALNAVTQTMLEEFDRLWTRVREDEGINAVIIRANRNSRAFTSGADVSGSDPFKRSDNVFMNKGALQYLGPKMNYCYKPVICAVHGICAGAGLFLVNESDIVLASEDAEFFDPHLSIGITSAMGPIGMTRRVNLGEVLRYTLLSNAERLTAQTALRIGLVTEVLPADDLWARAKALGEIVAGYEPVAVQGTLKAIWEGLDIGRKAGLDRAALYSDAARNSSTRGLAKPEGPRRKYERR